jgi:Maltokinase N-terminal cap domain
VAHLYQAELRPTKLELIQTWTTTRPWFVGDPTTTLEKVAAFRFDDPEGEVGIETLLVRVENGPVLQIPLTYRGSPLIGAESWLLGTIEHSVLGTRWTYDAAGDPAYIAAAATAALSGGTQADEFIDIDGVLVFREAGVRVQGDGNADTVVAPPPIEAVTTRDAGSATYVETNQVSLIVSRVVGTRATDEATAELTGTWIDQEQPCLLASVTVL